MTPVRRLLVGLDLSEETDGLVDSLPALRAWGVEELVLTHVAAASPVPILHRNDPTRGVAGKLSEAQACLEPHFRVSLCLAQGNPGGCLAEEAQVRSADGIVLGMRERSLLADALVGPTVLEVARHSSRPILLFPHASVESRRTRPILSPRSARVLHPVQLSGDESRANALVRDLAVEQSLPVSLLHVLDEGDPKAEMEVVEKLERLAGELREAGVPEVEILVDHGEPWERILSRAGERSHTLVVMGTHARGPIPTLLLGSQSREVARRSRLPLLLVPRKPEPSGQGSRTG
jgi:nucleotide-binding universal stress UspA family protein